MKRSMLAVVLFASLFVIGGADCDNDNRNNKNVEKTPDFTSTCKERFEFSSDICPGNFSVCVIKDKKTGREFLVNSHFCVEVTARDEKTNKVEKE